MILYVGLGRMGLPMAIHAIHAGQHVVGVDPSPERRAMLTAEGGTAVADVTEVLARAEAVVIMVGSQSQVAGIVGELMKGCAPGTLVIVVSTVSPHFIADLGKRAGEKSLRLVDAPVCRAEMGAIQGKLLAFLSGDATDCERAADLMRPYSSDIEIVGTRLGAAQVAKTVNNMILWACAIANEEGLRLAESWQLDVDALRRALVTSSADNWCLRNWDRIGQMPWSIKDMDIALEMASDSGVGIPLGEVVSKLVRTTSVLSHAT
jgi:3-hydroxyisobutyrate dehydrogenase-like beta-hydroxyacid dehydrogenase